LEKVLIVGRLSASSVKAWFQYRCERKTRYDMMTRAERDDAVIAKEESGASWAIEGNKFEERVLSRVRAEHPLLEPAADQDRLGQAETIAFLRGETRECHATQLGLEEGLSLRASLALPDNVAINRSYADLVTRDRNASGMVFRIVDIKATRRSTPFHKAQVAFYARLLQGMLGDLGVDASVDLDGEVWHIQAGSRLIDGLFDRACFPLKPYLRLVDEFLQRDAPRIASRNVSATNDETFYHIYFKCEQCDYLGHCRQAIDSPDPKVNDVSAIPGVSHQGKMALCSRRLKTVGDVSRQAGLAGHGPSSWSLQRRSGEIIARAAAQTANTVRRIPDILSYLMPPKVDRAFFLLADHDAVEENLVTLGYLRQGGAPRSLVRVIERSSVDAERRALLDIFTALINDLTEIDEHNASVDADQQLQAHIFVYEPAEAKSLQAAIGRHLDDPLIRTGLLHAVRIFPPDDVVPEPEFKGACHLPATALRSVVEQLFALPCRVSYDLRQVTEALVAAGKLTDAYEPEGIFWRDFSSLLSMEVIRSLREGRQDAIQAIEVEADVRARLQASANLVEWLIRENSAAAAAFLRLEKQPFRFQSTLDPLNAGDLDLLHAYEILESRSGLLATLVRLAHPVSVRQQRGECLAGLTLQSEGHHQNGRRWLCFTIPPESRDVEISPSDVGLILTDDSPNLRLNYGLWRELEIRFNHGGDNTLFVNLPAKQYNSPLFESLMRTTPPDGWCIDKTYRDFNGPKVQNFLIELGSIQS
jgi:hypothetical protein